MGLDIYAGTLTRYYCHNWKTAVQKWAEANGYAFHKITPEGEELPEQELTPEEVCDTQSAVAVSYTHLRSHGGSSLRVGPGKRAPQKSARIGGLCRKDTAAGGAGSSASLSLIHIWVWCRCRAKTGSRPPAPQGRGP